MVDLSRFSVQPNEVYDRILRCRSNIFTKGISLFKHRSIYGGVYAARSLTRRLEFNTALIDDLLTGHEA